jgi:hypothetical protein
MGRTLPRRLVDARRRVKAPRLDPGQDVCAAVSHRAMKPNEHRATAAQAQPLEGAGREGQEVGRLGGKEQGVGIRRQGAADGPGVQRRSRGVAAPGLCCFVRFGELGPGHWRGGLHRHLYVPTVYGVLCRRGIHPDFGGVTVFLGGSLPERFFLYIEVRYFLASSSSAGLKRVKAGGAVNLSLRSTKDGRAVQSAAVNGGVNCSR